MTQELTTRGPFDPNPGVLVRWMLKSGERSERPIAGSSRVIVRDGIQLYVPHPGGVTVLDFADVHEAGDLYVALEAHMENVAADQERADGVGPVEEARSMGEEERRSMTPNVPKVIDHGADFRAANMAAVQEQIDNPLFGGEDPGKSPVWAMDREFLEAMDVVVQAWTGAPSRYPVDHTVARERVAMAMPDLAAALDRLAALNA